MMLSWKSYAEWLVSANGVDVFDAIEIVNKCYQKQYNKALEITEIVQFLDERDKLNRLQPDDIEGPLSCPS